MRVLEDIAASVRFSDPVFKVEPAVVEVAQKEEYERAAGHDVRQDDEYIRQGENGDNHRPELLSVLGISGLAK